MDLACRHPEASRRCRAVAKERVVNLWDEMVAFRITMLRTAARFRGIWFAVFIWTLSPLGSTVAAVANVEQWGIYGVSLHGPTNGNPFVDVQFSARFTLGDTNVDANGFYDGGGMYRVRFMPGTQGRWH